jgi:uncharacterized membrane protein
MCHPSDFEHLMEPDPAPAPKLVAWSEHLATDYLAGLPAVEDAESFARTLVFGQRGRIACQRPDFDPHWCIVHSEDFAEGAATCEARS